MNTIWEDFNGKPRRKTRREMGYEQGFADAKAQFEPKWIPVSERLPKNNEEVWITDAEGKVERARFYKEPHPEDGEKDSFACRTYLVYAENVLAWQSILRPEPYKEGATDETTA